MDADFRGKVKPAPKKKRRVASDTKSKRKSAEAIRDAETPEAEAHPPPATAEARGGLPEQAGTSSQPSVRRSTRPRRTLEAQVLDERVFME
jgi:hypothetical protein